MKQFILSAPPDTDGVVRLSGSDFHYLVHVRRFKPGTVFNARLPGGEPVRIRVSAVNASLLEGECLPSEGKRRDEAPPAPLVPPLPRILLLQALPKGSKMDLIIRQAAEGGVATVVPFVSAHSVPRSGGHAERLERWRRIVREARQQSGSQTATEILPPRGFEELLEYWRELKAQYPRSLGLALHEAPLEQGTFHGYLGDGPELIAAAVGPEGGFSPQEIRRFTAAGFKPITMGSTVLRTETAALYVVAIIRMLLLESSSWIPKIPNL